ncbi:MAG: response regulator [Bacillota bacterium]
MKILSVDDITVVRKITRKVVERLGGEFFEATNGFEALAILEDNDGIMDLVLLDWNMPLMDGFIFLNKIRNNPKFEKIPVIMVTAESEKDKIIKAVQAGATNYIAKPFTEQNLTRKIIDCLGKEFEYEILAKLFADALGNIIIDLSGQQIQEITSKDIQPVNPEETGCFTGTIVALGKINTAVIVALGKDTATLVAKSATNRPPTEFNNLQLVDAVLRIVEQAASKAIIELAYIDENLYIPLITAGFTSENNHILHNAVHTSIKTFTAGENILRLQVHYF